MIRPGRAPLARAASTNAAPFRAKTSLRTIRHEVVHSLNARAITRFRNPGPNRAMSAIARMRYGKASSTRPPSAG